MCACLCEPLSLQGLGTGEWGLWIGWQCARGMLVIPACWFQGRFNYRLLFSGIFPAFPVELVQLLGFFQVPRVPIPLPWRLGSRIFPAGALADSGLWGRSLLVG